MKWEPSSCGFLKGVNGANYGKILEKELKYIKKSVHIYFAV